MRPTGEERNGPSKMREAWAMEKGPDILLEVTSVKRSWLIISGCMFADGRFGGRNFLERAGGLPMGEPYQILWGRLGNRDSRFEDDKAASQARGL